MGSTHTLPTLHRLYNRRGRRIPTQQPFEACPESFSSHHCSSERSSDEALIDFFFLKKDDNIILTEFVIKEIYLTKHYNKKAILRDLIV